MVQPPICSHARGKKLPGDETPLETLLWTEPFIAICCANTPNHIFAFLLSLHCSILDLTLRIKTQMWSPRLSIWLKINATYIHMMKTLSHACKYVNNWQILFFSLLKTGNFIYFYQCQPSKITKECAVTSKAVERLPFSTVMLLSGLVPTLFIARFVQVHKSVLYLILPLAVFSSLQKLLVWTWSIPAAWDDLLADSTLHHSVIFLAEYFSFPDPGLFVSLRKLFLSKCKEMVKSEYMFIHENSRQWAVEAAFPFDLCRTDIYSNH